MPNEYSEEWFREQSQGSRQSAKEVVPILRKLVNPKSVIDVGCGVGPWLAEFFALGVKDITGVDGNYVDRNSLQIPKNKFIPRDLKKPLKLHKKYDLVLSLEVAEHLPEKSAQTFVESLTSLGPVVVFSAATAHQGGNHHINEQWPEYWVEKFKLKNYVLIDCIRNKIWQNQNVEWWYAQNMFVFVKKDSLNNYPNLKRELNNKSTSPVTIIHPRNYLNKISDSKSPRKPFLSRVKEYVLKK